MFCAIVTVVWYYLSQIYETHWVWDSEHKTKFQYSGAFHTGKKNDFNYFRTTILLIGIYGMSNIYVFAFLILFSPVITNVDDMDELSKCFEVLQKIYHCFFL